MEYDCISNFVLNICCLQSFNADQVTTNNWACKPHGDAKYGNLGIFKTWNVSNLEPKECIASHLQWWVKSPYVLFS